MVGDRALTLTQKITFVFTFWGNVLDKAKNVIERGDTNEISIITTKF